MIPFQLRNFLPGLAVGSPDKPRVCDHRKSKGHGCKPWQIQQAGVTTVWNPLHWIALWALERAVPYWFHPSSPFSHEGGELALGLASTQCDGWSENVTIPLFQQLLRAYYRRILDQTSLQGKKQRPVKENTPNMGWLFVLKASQSNNQLPNPKTFPHVSHVFCRLEIRRGDHYYLLCRLNTLLQVAV